MDHAEFDLFADEYESLHKANISFSGEKPAYFARYKIAILRSYLSDSSEPQNILDFGSGIGNSIPHFRDFFPHSQIICTDVSSRSIEIAKRRFPGREESILIEGNGIPLASESVDVVFSACVFHHIPAQEHVTWFRELYRVLRPGGVITLFEHNPFNPLTKRAVESCPFDVNASLIRCQTLAARMMDADWIDIKTRYHLFFPRSLSFLRRIEPALNALPFGAQYSIFATKRLL